MGTASLPKLHRDLLVRGLAVLILVILNIASRPWYSRYVEAENTWTCFDARHIVERIYARKLYVLLREGKPLTTDSILELATEAFETNMDYTVVREADTLTVFGLCRDDGYIFVRIVDESTGELCFDCSNEKHDDVFTRSAEDFPGITDLTQISYESVR